MADFRWFSKWNRENPTRIWGPAYLAGAVGGGILVAALVVTWGYPWKAVGLQTGPRGTGMDVIKFEPPLARPDPTADAFYTEAAIVPVGGETLARDAYQNVQVLGDLTEDNFNRLMMAITQWVAPEQGCAYCHGDEGDFAGDQLYTKNVARHMIQMTQHINETYPEHVQPAGVTCYTCHRGENRPSGTFYNLVPVVDVMEGWSANQNRVTPVSEWTSLPSDALQKYLVEYEPIRVSDLEPRVPSEGTASIQRTERTFSLMNHQSNALGVNCTFCHNSRAFYDLDQSTPQLLQAQLGIAMALDINNEYVLPLGELLPANRLGPVHQDPPKVACMTCHKGNAKPVGGLAVLHDWPELGSSEPPVYE